MNEAIVSDDNSIEVLGKDLFDVIGEVDMQDCYSHDYYKWENSIATSRLKELGYTALQWWSGDSDSFGPLVRCVRVKKDGVEEVLIYG